MAENIFAAVKFGAILGDSVCGPNLAGMMNKRHSPGRKPNVEFIVEQQKSVYGENTHEVLFIVRFIRDGIKSIHAAFSCKPFSPIFTFT